jgi:osmotically-inducible protein OsmY
MTTSTMSDLDLLQHVSDELRWDPAVAAEHIVTSVDHGAVTLSGSAPTLAGRLAAVRAAKRVKGVHVVADDVEVRPTERPGRSDHDIAHVVDQLLNWNTQIPDTVTATVRGRVVTLEGTADWDYQRRAAERTVSHLDAVERVINNITLASASSPRQLRHNITAALHRSADIDAHAIEVDSREGHVWLSGRVSSWAQRERAEAAAWAAPGVTAVHNDISVG